MRSRIITSGRQYGINLDLSITPTEIKIVYSIMVKQAIEGELDPEKWPDVPGKQHELVLDIYSLRKKRDWKPGSTFILTFDYELGTYIGMVNGTAESYSARRDPSNLVSVREHITPIRLIIPFADADFSDIGIQVVQNASAYFESNEPFVKYVSDNINLYHAQVREFLPHLTIIGPDEIKAGAIATYRVEATRFGKLMTQPLTVYPESTAGYLPKHRFELVAGSGEFKLRALDLEAGDSVELKMGLRYNASKATKIVEIVE